jgi:hypothetical protein
MFSPEKKQLLPVNGFTVCRGLRTSRFGIPLPYPESTLTPYGRTAKKTRGISGTMSGPRAMCWMSFILYVCILDLLADVCP